jgi:LDH2 family malate/lactate/ureidoglycolate dehydrogenase
MVVEGKFDVKCFYETLARIISEKENVKVTVHVTLPEDAEREEQESNKRKGIA